MEEMDEFKRNRLNEINYMMGIIIKIIIIIKLILMMYCKYYSKRSHYKISIK